MSAVLAATGMVSPSPQPKKTRSQTAFRVAFLTDVHLPATGQDERFAKALRHAEAQKPDLVIFGGDNVFCVNGVDKPTAQGLFDNWNSVLSKGLTVPYLTCVGNHDVWHSGSKDDPLYGSAWARKAFGMKSAQQAVVKGGWKFLILDTFVAGGFGGAQFEWLKNQLEQTKEMPVAIVSHISILNACSFLENGIVKDGSWAIPGDWVTTETRTYVELFAKHPNVRLCLSGHMHQIDLVELKNVKYICGGSVGGAWWGGDYLGFPPAYVLLDLKPNGEVSHKVIYWEKPRP